MSTREPSSDRPLGEPPSTVQRRRFLAVLSGLGFGVGVFPEVLWGRLQDATEVTLAAIADAERIAGVAFSLEDRQLMLAGLRGNRESFEALRELGLSEEAQPAFLFDPTPAGQSVPEGPSLLRLSEPRRLPDPRVSADLAFASIGQLSALLRAGAVTSTQLTELYLERLRRYGDQLQCVVTLTEDLALEQATRADRELGEGLDRGPLHGIPWGAKDLLATRGYPTTWGADPFRDRALDSDATVVRRLEEAGAVLVAKLTLGALARGDQWFGGRTRNPWNLEFGSSGSSAGSAAATAAGLVAFSLGSETVGSIVTPSTRCGASALRPTFGRVSRHGAMTLSWTMDKIGPICRSTEDCAVVLAAIQGADGLDRSARDVPFAWDSDRGLEGVRLGYLEPAFDSPGESQEQDRAVLTVLSALGASLMPVGFPTGLPVTALRLILSSEASASFDDLTRSGLDDELLDQSEAGWPNRFRTARLIPAVEYLQATRARGLLMEALADAWRDVDVVVAPTFSENLVLATNLSGHPTVVVPNGHRPAGMPGSISFVGAVWKDAEALGVARVFQEATTHHLRRPPGFG